MSVCARPRWQSRRQACCGRRFPTPAPATAETRRPRRLPPARAKALSCARRESRGSRPTDRSSRSTAGVFLRAEFEHRGRPLLLPQVAARQRHEHIFEARLARGEVRQLRALLLYRRQQRGNRVVRLVPPAADKIHLRSVPIARRAVGPRSRRPSIAAADGELHDVMPAKAARSAPPACPAAMICPWSMMASRSHRRSASSM